MEWAKGKIIYSSSLFNCIIFGPVMASGQLAKHWQSNANWSLSFSIILSSEMLNQIDHHRQLNYSHTKVIIFFWSFFGLLSFVSPVCNACSIMLLRFYSKADFQVPLVSLFYPEQWKSWWWKSQQTLSPLHCYL